MEGARDAETGAPTAAARPQHQRSSVPSFLFISFMLFMLTNHNGDEFLARNQYQDAIQSLEWQRGNYSAWLNGTESNFVMPERIHSVDPLLEPFLEFGSRLDPSQSSYYPNITGFIHGDAKFHNLTAPQDSVWRPAAERFMATTNLTGVGETLGQWNWTNTNKISLSVSEKLPAQVNESSSARGVSAGEGQIAFIHGKIELTDSVAVDDLKLEFEGVHFISNGSIYGYAVPIGQKIDIREVPCLVPPAHQNETASTIEPELTARINKLEQLVDTGVIDQDIINNDEPAKTACSFAFYGQIEASDVPEHLMQDLENELQRPTGIWTVKTPKLSVNGVLISKDCGILYEVANTEGLRSRRFFRRVNTYAGLAALSYFILLVLFMRQTEQYMTPAGLSRMSRWTFLTQAILDAVSFAGHITFAILAEGRPSLALVAPAFLACVLFVNEAQQAHLIFQIQLPEAVVVTPPQPSPDTPSQASAPRPPPSSESPATPANQTPAAAIRAPAPQPTTLPSPNSPSFWSLFIAHIRSDPQAKLWLGIFVFMTFIVRIILSPSLALMFVGTMYSCFWAPQIVRAARRGRSGVLTKEYLIGTTICRLWFAFYFLACPKNVLDVEPRPWVYLLACFMFFQILVLVLQDWIGPAFFLPKRYAAVETYNYHPSIPLPDSEAPEQSLGDCSICMDAILVDSSLRRKSKSSDEMEKGDRDHSVTGGILEAVHMASGGGRKNYSLAPCHHLFHTECLERWLAIKNICPQCRRPLPPL